MLAAVDVAGVTVTQELLERACEFIAERNSLFSCDGYKPSLSRLKPPSGSTINLEQYAWLCFEQPDTMHGFKEGVLEPRQAERTPQAVTLELAGVPSVALMRLDDPVPQGIAEWVAGYQGHATPWLWVTSQDSTQRISAIAQAVTGAHRAMEDGKAPHGRILYADTYDVCGRVDTANQYGAGSKWEVVREWMACDLLALDGLGEEAPSPRTFDTLARIIAARWSSTLPTVIASRKTMREWLDPYMRIDQAAARDTARKVTQCLCAYKQDAGSARQQLAKHIVNLDS